jgi:hypothetical protein
MDGILYAICLRFSFMPSMIDRPFCIFVLLAVSAVCAMSQAKPAAGPAVDSKPASIASSPSELAKAAVAAHGGDKLRQVKSLVIRGSVDFNVSGVATPATFSIAISGDKYFFEINNPVQPLKQTYDGRETFSTIRGFSLPPITSLGFPVLTKIGDTGYVVSDIGESKKKRKGFRVTTPDGYYTDFLIDEKTGQVKGYESSYEVGDRNVTTSVEIDEFQTIDGVSMPKKYSQRIDLGQLTAYANFKVKEMLINSAIDDSVFAMPK